MTKHMLCGYAHCARSDWTKHKPKQGYSYGEVYQEMLRRHRGEYQLTPKERDVAFARGKKRVEREFRLATLLADYLRTEAMSAEQLAEMLTTTDAIDTLKEMLNPYYRAAESDGSVFDQAYPGIDVQRSS